MAGIKTLINIDLEDGLPRLSFTLNAVDAARFQGFMADCDRAVEAAKEVDRMRAVVKANHEWHLAHDDHDGYQESDLGSLNASALGLEGS